MIGDKHLTGETDAQAITHPGQASFAIVGEKRVCRDCWFWAPKRPTDMKGVCLKAAAMTAGPRRPVAVPRFATICKYFTKDEPPQPEFGDNLAA